MVPLWYPSVNFRGFILISNQRKDALYLIRRNSTYYYRIKIPKDIRSRFGTSEFRFSLRTPYLIHAKRLSESITDFIHQIFNNIRQEGKMSTLSKDQLQTIIKEYVKDFTEGFELEEATNSRKLNPYSHIDQLRGYDFVLSEDHNTLAERRHVKRMTPEADEVMERMGLSLDKSSDDYHLLCWLLLKARIRSLEACKSRLVHKLQGHTIEDILKDLDIVITDRSVLMPTSEPTSSIRLSEVIDAFWKDRSSNWKARSLRYDH